MGSVSERAHTAGEFVYRCTCFHGHVCLFGDKETFLISRNCCLFFFLMKLWHSIIVLMVWNVLLCALAVHWTTSMSDGQLSFIWALWQRNIQIALQREILGGLLVEINDEWNKWVLWHVLCVFVCIFRYAGVSYFSKTVVDQQDTSGLQILVKELLTIFNNAKSRVPKILNTQSKILQLYSWNKRL